MFWRSAPSPNPAVAPALYLHGVPSSSEDWIAPREHHGSRPLWKRWWRHKRSGDDWVQAPLYERGFLERTGGLAPDLPGFGRSGKPGYLRYTIEEYAGFIERFLDMLASSVCACSCTTGARWDSRSPKLILSESSGWSCATRCRCCPGTSGTAPHACGARRCWERSRWARPTARARALDSEANVTPGPLARRLDRLGHGALRPGHPARDPAAVSQLSERALAKAGEQLESLRMPSLVTLGHAGSLHTRALCPRLCASTAR